MTMETSIVERLNLFISAKGIKKSDIATALNWEKKTVYNQLNGACELSLNLLVGICQLYPELNTQYVLLGNGSMEELLEGSAQKQIEELKIKLREKDAQIKVLTKLAKS